MTKLSERAVRASLHVGAWSGRVVDYEVSAEVAETNKAENDAGRYNKQLVATKFLRHVGSKVNVARATHRILTLPWDDDARILSTTGYQHYTQSMRLHRLAVEAAANEFAAGMADYIKEAEVRLGSMFDRTEYPSSEDVRKKFYIDVEISPIAEAGDFRAELSEASTKAIIKDIERRGDQRIERALNDVFQRVAGCCEKMVERLRNYEPATGPDRVKNSFRDSLVYNIKELAELLPSLNITGDPRIEKLQQQLLDDLTAHSPEILKVDEKVRRKTADKAEKILKRVQGFLA